MPNKKTVVISGGSRGIGGAIAKLLAQLGWNVVILAKHALVPHQKLDGDRTVAQEIAGSGGSVLALPVDVRFQDQVEKAIAEAVHVFGGIDALVNNASALYIDNPTEKQITLMNEIIVNGTQSCIRKCLPHLLKASNPHVVSIAPPLPMEEHWIKKYGAYAVAKRTVSEYSEKMGKEWRSVAFHTLWPVKMIYTAATIFGVFKSEEEARKRTRNPEIMADAVRCLLQGSAPSYENCFFDTDEKVLEFYMGMGDFSRYLMPGSKEKDLMSDIFV